MKRTRRKTLRRCSRQENCIKKRRRSKECIAVADADASPSCCAAICLSLGSMESFSDMETIFANVYVQDELCCQMKHTVRRKSNITVLCILITNYCCRWEYSGRNGFHQITLFYLTNSNSGRNEKIYHKIYRANFALFLQEIYLPMSLPYLKTTPDLLNFDQKYQAMS